MKIFESVLLLALEVLVVDNILKHRLNLFDAAEQGHVVALGRSFLILLLTNVEQTLFLHITVDHVGFGRIKDALLLLNALTSV